MISLCCEVITFTTSILPSISASEIEAFKLRPTEIAIVLPNDLTTLAARPRLEDVALA